MLSMITKLTVVETESTDVFVNQGVEYALFDRVQDNELILYLWANDNVVVIGRNQDAYAECRIESLESDGGKLARRLSGGGAVYHDLGNLNFTFIAKSADFSLDKNRAVILRALKSLGVNAVLTGRNDIEVDGFKVSGNAYYKHDGKEYHHGTMLISSTADKVAKYLTPASTKFAGKAVKSVKSRVSNLNAFNPDVTAKTFADAMKQAIKEEYPSATYADVPPISLGFEPIMNGLKIFVNDEWRYGKKPDEYNFRMPIDVDGKTATLALNVDENDTITLCDVFSDDLDFNAGQNVKEELTNKNLKTDNGAILDLVKKEWYEI